MKLLTNEQQESYKNAKICCICKEKFENRYLKHKRHRKIRDHCYYAGKYRGATNIVYLKKIPAVFHHGSNYDYHFIMKELAGWF